MEAAPSGGVAGAWAPERPGGLEARWRETKTQTDSDRGQPAGHWLSCPACQGRAMLACLQHGMALPWQLGRGHAQLWAGTQSSPGMAGCGPTAPHPHTSPPETPSPYAWLLAATTAPLSSTRRWATVRLAPLVPVRRRQGRVRGPGHRCMAARRRAMRTCSTIGHDVLTSGLLTFFITACAPGDPCRLFSTPARARVARSRNLASLPQAASRQQQDPTCYVCGLHGTVEGLSGLVYARAWHSGLTTGAHVQSWLASAHTFRCLDVRANVVLAGSLRQEPNRQGLGDSKGHEQSGGGSRSMPSWLLPRRQQARTRPGILYQQFVG